MSMFAKEIRGEFYELSKDVWGEDLYQFDPDWWDSYYAGDKLTGFRAFIAENLLAIDPATNEISLFIKRKRVFKTSIFKKAEHAGISF